MTFNFIKKVRSYFNRSQIGVCSICNKEFFDKKLHIEDALSFCPEDYRLYKEKNWICINQVKGHPDKPENALLLSDLKVILLQKNIPSFITTQYSEEKSTLFTTFFLYIPDQYEQEYHILVK